MTIYPSKYFHSNKYTSWYENIVNNARINERRKGCGVYYERHHVIPKSFFDDTTESNYVENLILLTAREHYICHLLLTRMCIQKAHHEKMIHAYNMLCNSSKFEERHIKCTSRTYTILREEHSNICGKIWDGRHHTEESKKKMSISHKGKVLTEEHKKNIGIAVTGRIVTGETRRKIGKIRLGIPHTEESKKKMSKSHMGKIISEETRKRMSLSHMGKTGLKHTEETKRRLSEINTGMPRSEKMWEITLPTGDVIRITNMAEYCRKNNLHRGHMSQVSKGNLTHHKGYKCKKLD